MRGYRPAGTAAVTACTRTATLEPQAGVQHTARKASSFGWGPFLPVSYFAYLTFNLGIPY